MTRILRLPPQNDKLFAFYNLPFAFCLVFLCGSLSGCGPQVKNLNSTGSSIICFGDSLTAGEGAGPGEDYPSVLAGRLKQPVINAGVPGDTTRDGLARIRTDVLDRGPKLVIVEFGGNDFLHQLPRDETFGNLGQMVDLIQQKGAAVALVDLGVDLTLGSGYREGMRRLARRKGAILIPDVLKGIFADPDLKSDQIHPNGRGYAVMAQRVYIGLKPYLQ